MLILTELNEASLLINKLILHVLGKIILI